MYDPGPEKLSHNSISLHRNENLFADQLFLKELLLKAIDDTSLSSYPESSSNELKQAIGNYHNCNPENIYVGNGADGVLADIFSFLRNQHNEIGLQPYTYLVYPFLCERYGYKVKGVKETGQLWVIDSPNSINGEIFDFASVKKLPTTLIWDNVYGDFDPNNKLFNSRTTEIIRIHSFSKFFSLASLRVGYCIGSSKFISALMQRKDIFNVNALGQKTAIQALKNVEYFSSLVQKIQSAKQSLSEGLKNNGFIVNEGKANFIWVTHPSIKMKDLQEELANELILVRRFQNSQLENHLRITVPPKEIVSKLLLTIEKIAKKLHS